MSLRSVVLRGPAPSGAALPPIAWTLLALAGALGLAVAMAVASAMTVLVLAMLIVGVLVLLRPDTATPLTLGLIYSNAAVVAAQFHGVPYLVAAVVPALLLLPLGYRLLVQRKPIIVTAALPFLALYLLVLLLSALASGDVETTLEELSLFVTQGMALYILVTNALYSASLIRTAIWVMVLVGAALAAMAVFQQLTGNYGNDFFGFAQSGQSIRLESGEVIVVGDALRARASGPIGETNRFAQALIVLVPLALFRYWGEASRGLRALALSSSVVITIGVLLTLSRGAALGFAALMVSLVALRYLSIRHLVLIGVAAVILAMAVPGYAQRLLSLEGLGEAAATPGQTDADTVLQQRANDVLVAALLFVENPVLGVGPGRFTTLYRDHATRVGGLPGAQDYQAHSLFPGIAAETGVLGVLVFAAILLVTLRQLWRARTLLHDTRPELSNLVTGFLVALITYLGTSFALHLSYQRYFWLLMAAAGAAAYVALAEARRMEREGGLPARPAADPAPSAASGS